MKQIILYRLPNPEDNSPGFSENEDQKVKDYETSIQSLWNKYKDKQKIYLDAALEYNNLRTNALNGNDAKAINDWAVNANLYRDKVKAALNDWIIEGRKNEVESMLAHIEQVKGKRGNS